MFVSRACTTYLILAPPRAREHWVLAEIGGSDVAIASGNGALHYRHLKVDDEWIEEVGDAILNKIVQHNFCTSLISLINTLKIT